MSAAGAQRLRPLLQPAHRLADAAQPLDRRLQVGDLGVAHHHARDGGPWGSRCEQVVEGGAAEVLLEPLEARLLLLIGQLDQSRQVARLGECELEVQLLAQRRHRGAGRHPILEALEPLRGRLVDDAWRPAHGAPPCGGSVAVAGGDRAHEPFLLQLVEGDVDRAGVQLPGRADLLLEALHEVVAVAASLRQQPQDRVLHRHRAVPTTLAVSRPRDGIEGASHPVGPLRGRERTSSTQAVPPVAPASIRAMLRRARVLALPIGFALALAIGACGSDDVQESGATVEPSPLTAQTTAPVRTATTTATTTVSTTTAAPVTTTTTTATTPTTTQPSGGATTTQPTTGFAGGAGGAPA